jgi:hypothetical protein
VTARVIHIRPHPSPHPSPSRPDASRSVPIGHHVTVEWDGVRDLYLAACRRCCETLTTQLLDQAHNWAEAHTCDPELTALLADITPRHTRRNAA